MSLEEGAVSSSGVWSSRGAWHFCRATLRSYAPSVLKPGLADEPHIALDLVTRALERAGYMAVTEMVPQSSLTSVLECLQTAVIEATQNVQTPTQTGQKTSSRRRPYAVCSSRRGPHYRPAGCPR